jgi:alpha-beta hydrolase superfamily lysophospholipase
VGGTVATTYSLSHQADCSGMVLSGPTLQPGASVPRGLMLIAPLLSRLIPRTGLYTIDSSAISRDRSVIEAYQNDPLVYRGKICTRLGIELLKTMKTLPAQFPKIRLPILILHGSDDRLSNPQGSQILYDRASSMDKTLKYYAGFYHEIFNEPGREKVFQDMEEWLLRLSERT